MKKIICLATLICGLVFTQLNATTYTTSCGIKVPGPSRNYFETEEDYQGFLQDLEDFYCGPKDLFPMPEDPELAI